MHPLLGTWLLTETRAFDEAGQGISSPFGTRPMGVVRFEADRRAGRMVGVVADGSPEAPAGSPQRALFSYTGTYVFDGERLVTHVDGASSPDKVNRRFAGSTLRPGPAARANHRRCGAKHDGAPEHVSHGASLPFWHHAKGRQPTLGARLRQSQQRCQRSENSFLGFACIPTSRESAWPAARCPQGST